MAINYRIDESRVLHDYCGRVMKDHKKFRILAQLRFLFVWRVGDPEYDNKDGGMIAASVHKLPSRMRDLFKKDIELRVNYEYWDEMSESQRYRTIFHELSHVQIELDANFEVVLDDDERIKFRIVGHDIVMKTFQAEIDLFGLPPEYTRQVVELGKHVNSIPAPIMYGTTADEQSEIERS
jgi:hypothetical protein